MEDKEQFQGKKDGTLFYFRNLVTFFEWWIFECWNCSTKIVVSRIEVANIYREKRDGICTSGRFSGPLCIGGAVDLPISADISILE